MRKPPSIRDAEEINNLRSGRIIIANLIFQIGLLDPVQKLVFSGQTLQLIYFYAVVILCRINNVLRRILFYFTEYMAVRWEALHD